MAETITSDQTLVASELPSVRTWISFQNTFGVGRKQPSTADIANYLNGLVSLTNAYTTLQNPKVKAWIEQLFSFMVAKDDAAKMYLVWQYLVFTTYHQEDPPAADCYNDDHSVNVDARVDTWVNYWNVFAITHHYAWKKPVVGHGRLVPM